MQSQQLVLSSTQPDRSQLPLVPRCHVIPATAKEPLHDAQVSNYFEPTIQPHPLYEDRLEASLLGHELVGRAHPTPNMYDAYVMREAGDVNVVLVRRIGEVMDWRKDRPWADNDGPVQNITKWMQLEAALHGDQ